MIPDIPAEGIMQADLAVRSSEARWPVGFEPHRAALFAHNEARMEAPCEVVWQYLVDVRSWPDWYPNSRDVSLLEGATELRAGTRWRWTTFGLAIESRVTEFLPGRTLAWFGGTQGEPPTFHHLWMLAPEGSGCRVVTEEAGVGEGAAAFRKADESRMHRGHALWLATLRWMAEGQ